MLSLQPEHPWLQAPSIREVCPEVPGVYLAPMLAEGVVERWIGEAEDEPACGHQRRVDDCPDCLHFEHRLIADPPDPDDPIPQPHRSALGPVVRERLAAGLVARDLPQSTLDLVDLALERVDHEQRDRDPLPGVLG